MEPPSVRHPCDRSDTTPQHLGAGLIHTPSPFRIGSEPPPQEVCDQQESTHLVHTPIDSLEPFIEGTWNPFWVRNPQSVRASTTTTKRTLFSSLFSIIPNESTSPWWHSQPPPPPVSRSYPREIEASSSIPTGVDELLAVWTPHRAALTDHLANQAVSARPATFALPAVHVEQVLPTAGFPQAISIIPHGGPAGIDRLFEEVTNRLGEASDRLPIKSIGGGHGVDAGPMEGLVGVDVSDSGEHPLVEEGGLHVPSRCRESGPEIPGLDRSGVGSEAGAIVEEASGGREDHEIAEAARIDASQQQSPALPGSDPPANVFVGNSSGRPAGFDGLHEHPAGHAEPDAESAGTAFDQGQLLPVAIDPIDRRADEGTSPLGRRVRGQMVASPHRRGLDRAALDDGERSSDAFDFGKFRHGVRSWTTGRVASGARRRRRGMRGEAENGLLYSTHASARRSHSQTHAPAVATRRLR